MTRARSTTPHAAAPDDAPPAPAPSHAERLADLESRLAEIEALGLADLVSGHRTAISHARLLEARSEQIEAAARSAVEAARAAAREQRAASARERAGERVRVRAAQDFVDVWIGPRGERLVLDPKNTRADVCRLVDRAEWARSSSAQATSARSSTTVRSSSRIWRRARPRRPGDAHARRGFCRTCTPP